MASEFELIRRHFARPARTRDERLVLGVGDDAALLRAAPGMVLAASTDMLLEGRHFTVGADPRLLGHKALAVNLSDLAAMGATPRWATLAIALPSDDERWLTAFADGLYALADEHGVTLVGGDTTRGPLSISITVLGEVPEGLALLRSGARAGDDVWVSGELGGAALALAAREGRARLEAVDETALFMRLDAPKPRVALGERLRALASACIDVSDGFAADLGHILERSSVGARIRYEALPRASAFARLNEAELERRCVLAGGDDYELVFTATKAKRAELAALAHELALPLARVGEIEASEGRLSVLDAQDRTLPHAGGFDHFAGTR